MHEAVRSTRLGSFRFYDRFVIGFITRAMYGHGIISITIITLYAGAFTRLIHLSYARIRALTYDYYTPWKMSVARETRERDRCRCRPLGFRAADTIDLPTETSRLESGHVERNRTRLAPMKSLFCFRFRFERSGSVRLFSKRVFTTLWKYVFDNGKTPAGIMFVGQRDNDP
jgi:hypothetical protein